MKGVAGIVAAILGLLAVGFAMKFPEMRVGYGITAFVMFLIAFGLIK